MEELTKAVGETPSVVVGMPKILLLEDEEAEEEERKKLNEEDVEG